MQANMYCPSCGATTTPNLNYCNRCGASLSLPTHMLEQHAPVSVTGPAWAFSVAMIVICTFGLKTIFSGIEDLAMRGVHGEVLGMLIVFGSIVLLGSVALLTWQFARLFNHPKLRASSRAQQVQSTTRSEARIPHQLNEHPQHVASVTEHTTRIFEPAYKSPSHNE